MHATVFIATSLDGFIAREDGAIDWLPAPDLTPGAEDYGYQEFFATVDVLVMGRNSYELVRTFPTWYYGSKRVLVLTTRDIDIPESLRDTVEATAATPSEVIAMLAAQGAKHLYIDGGKTVQSFLAERLIQTLIITRVPVLIGAGIPLFGALPADQHWVHEETKSYPSGLVQSRYELAPSATN